MVFVDILDYDLFKIDEYFGGAGLILILFVGLNMIFCVIANGGIEYGFNGKLCDLYEILVTNCVGDCL